MLLLAVSRHEVLPVERDVDAGEEHVMSATPNRDFRQLGVAGRRFKKREFIERADRRGDRHSVFEFDGELAGAVPSCNDARANALATLARCGDLCVGNLSVLAQVAPANTTSTRPAFVDRRAGPTTIFTSRPSLDKQSSIFDSLMPRNCPRSMLDSFG